MRTHQNMFLLQGAATALASQPVFCWCLSTWAANMMQQHSVLAGLTLHHHLLLQDAAQSLQGLLPDLPDLRKQLDALLGAPLRDLEAQLHLAGNETIKAAKAASSGLVSGLATALQGINKVLIDGQWQVGSKAMFAAKAVLQSACKYE